VKDRDGLVRGAILSLCLFDFVFGAVAVALRWAGRQPFRAIPMCSEIAERQWLWETGHHPARIVIHTWQTD